jgi:hypothetical protein
MPRRTLFALLLLLLIGLAAGLYYGWVIAPVRYVDADPASLHPAFKDDYVLMIATAYAGDGNLDAARAALARLGFAEPAAAVTASAERLAAAGLPRADQARLAALAAALAAVPQAAGPG